MTATRPLLPAALLPAALLCLLAAAQEPQAPPADAPPESPSPAPLFALVGATLFPMTPGGEAGPATVLVQGDRILEVGQDLQPAPGAEVIDVTGLFLVPGLVDGAVNHDVEHDPLYVASGVTLVRDTGNDPATVLTERQRVRRDLALGPSLLISGRILDGANPATAEALVLRDAREARAGLAATFAGLAAEEERQGLEPGTLALDFLSFHQGLSRPAWREVLRIAHGEQVDLPVWGPLPRGVALAEVLEVGQDGIFGLNALLPPGQGWHQVEPAAVEAGIEALAGAGLAVTPMLAVYARMSAPRPERQLSFLGPYYAPGWRAQAAEWEGEGERIGEWTGRALASQRAALGSLWRRGVTLVPGSGAPNPWLFPGTSLLDELDQWVAAGIPPIEVLRMATAGAAQALGQGGERGTLEPGRLADLVVLGSDPRQSLAGLRDPELVVLRGRVLERDELAGRLDSLLELQDAARAELTAELEIDLPQGPPGDVVLAGYAETTAFGSRITAERWSVVKTYDGRLAYCTRMVLPATATTAAHQMHLVQLFAGDRLVQFDLLSESLDPGASGGMGRLEVRGTLIGSSNRMTVRRSGERGIIDQRTADDPISLVDLSDVLTAMIVGRHLAEGTAYALGLEGGALEPVADRWRVSVNAGDHGIQVQTSRGPLAFALGEEGAPRGFARRVGTGTTELELGPPETFGGPGLPPPPERVFVAAAADDGQPPPEDTEDTEDSGDGKDREDRGDGGDGPPPRP